jgi:hypothetical protein
MRNRMMIMLLGAALGVFVYLPSLASADSATQTYQLVMEQPNVAQAPNGDRVMVTGGGTFSVNPKSVSASGAFTHTTSSGTTLGSGTWTATQLLSYQSTGCGVVLGMTIPANFCGGLLGMRVLLTPTGGQAREGILWVQCIIGPNPPNSRDDESEEGVRLDIPGVINFNKVVTGMNVYIRTS